MYMLVYIHVYRCILYIYRCVGTYACFPRNKPVPSYLQNQGILDLLTPHLTHCVTEEETQVQDDSGFPPSQSRTTP